MGNVEGLVRIVKELRVERTNLVNELKHVDAALAVLVKLNAGSNYTKPRRTLSASARKRISLAQKARWAKRAVNGKAAKVNPGEPYQLQVGRGSRRRSEHGGPS